MKRISALIFILLTYMNIVMAGGGAISDLSVNISSNSNAFFAGQRSLIQTTVTNIGPDSAGNIQLELRIESPVPIRNLTISSSLECQLEFSVIQCQTNNLSPNESREVNIAFIPTDSETNEYVIQVQALIRSSSIDENQSNNNAIKSIQVTAKPTQQQWGNALIDVLGSDGTRLNQMVRALAAYCGVTDNFLTAMAGNCDNLFIEALNGNKTVVKKVLRRLRPREVVQQARTSVEIIATQQANLAARMAQVRAGVGNSIAGLSMSASGKNLPIGMLGYLSDNDTDSSYSQLVSPWGFFINGQISSGDYQYNDARDEGFDFDTDGITAGVDYRINAKTVIGVALGYAKFDSTVGKDAKMESSALTFSAYGSFNVTDNFYIDARLSYGQPDFDQKRAIEFDLTDSQTDVNAVGSTEGKQQSIIITSGYQFNKNGWQVTPSISAEFYKTDIDAFVETGAQAFNVGFSEQNFETSRFTAGFQANKSIGLSNGVLIPSVGYEFIHENQNGDQFVLMRIAGMPAGEFFRAETDFNDTDYSSANAGITYIMANGKQAYLQYSKVYGFDGLDRYSVNLGARFEF